MMNQSEQNKKDDQKKKTTQNRKRRNGNVKKTPPKVVLSSIHDYIAFNSNEEYERSIFQFYQMVDNLSIKEAKTKIDELVSKVFPKKEFLRYTFSSRGRNAGTIFAFDTGYKFKKGPTESRERIFAYTLKNTRREDDRTHEYYGFFVERESMLRDMIRSRVSKWHIGDIVFDGLDNMNQLLEKLAEDSFYENWTFPNYNSRIKHPILKNYIENTYYQLFHQGKILINENEEKMLFNTGLIDTSFNEVFIVCDIEHSSAETGANKFENTEKSILFTDEYKNPVIYKSGNRVFSNYSQNKTPEMAMFYNDPGELLFDWEIAQKPGGINIADEHIFIDNMDRINRGLRDLRIRFNFDDPGDVTRCRQMFEGALKASLELSKRNYKFVAPQFWPATGKIQFLMPIYLEGIQEIRDGDTTAVSPPTVALSMEMVHGQYIGTTILTLDMAYQNARLIARPDGFWLDSTKIFAQKSDDDDQQ